MKLAVERVDDVDIVMLCGQELDASNVTQFKNDIAPVLEVSAKLVLDMSQVQFIDSSGLGSLLSCLRQVRTRDGDLKLCGILKPVQAVFDLVRMHKIFDIYGTREEAVRAFEQ
jgi:anti-sigma B factor antagonist